jgi:hypothetical protein
MESLIENAHVLFDERLPPSSPPLPPAPVEEPVPDISYGSSHTMVTLSQSGEAQVEDFTPQLPPRPTSSIHPSARSNPPMSPPHMPVDLLGCPTPTTLPTPLPAVPLTGQISADETEQSTQVQVPNASATEVVERAPNQLQVSLPPSPASTLEQQQQQQVVDGSVPETPLAASSRTSTSSESR